MSRRLILAVCALGVAALTTLAVTLGGPGVTLQNARAIPLETGGGSVAIVLEMASASDTDRLLGANAPNGAARLTGLDGGDHVPIPSGGSIALTAEGAHVLVVGFDGALSPGRTVDVVLVFERAGELTVQAPIDLSGDTAGAPFMPPPETPHPNLSVDATPRVDGGWTVLVDADQFQFSGNGGVAPGVGFATLFVNGGKMGRMVNAQMAIPPLPAGRHRLRVTLKTGDNRPHVVDGAPVSAFHYVEQR